MRRHADRCGSALLAVLLVLFLVAAASADEVVRSTLGNGLRVVIVRNTLAPAVTTQLNYLVGSDEAPVGFPGTAHALEHMMFRGSPGLSADQLATLIAAMGGDFNADTQQTITQYFFTVPAEALETALHVEAVRMRAILGTERLWRKERGAIEQEVVQDLSDPEYRLSIKILAHLFAGTPYAHDALGTRPSFDRTSAAMLRRFHRDWYAPNNAILVIVGNVDPAATLTTVKRLFGSIAGRPLPTRAPCELRPLKPGSFDGTSDLPYGLAVVAYRLPGYDSPDYAPGQILADILASERGKIYGLVPDGKALFAGFSANPLPHAGVGYAMAAFPQGGDGTRLIAELKGIVATYLKEGFPAELVEAAKRHEAAQAEFQKNSLTGLADAWSQALAVEGRNSPDDDRLAIARVSVADVNRVAREYLQNDTALTAVLTPQPAGTPIAGGKSRGRESFTPRQARAVRLPPWARQITKLPGPPPAPPAPADFTLANGLRLLVVPTTISNSVTFIGQVKNNPDLETAPGKEGTADLLDGLFSYGTTTLDRLAFQKALDDIAAEAEIGTSFSLQVLADYSERGIALLADNLLHPVLPEPAFSIVRRETAASLAGELKSPGYLAQRALREALFPAHDPALRQATPDTVNRLTLADVRNYYQTVFRPDMTTIVAIGAITPEKAKSLVERYFGDWRAAGPPPQTDLPAVPANRVATVSVPDPGRVQDEVTMAETLGLRRTDPDYYPLQVGLHVLSGGFYATRLYRELRERTGLVYTVEAFLEAGKNRSLFGVVYGCDPRNAERAKLIVQRVISDLQRQPVTAAELEQAKTLLLRQIPLAQADTGQIAMGLLERVEQGLPLDEPTVAARRYLAISAQKVRTAFARWLRPRGFAQVRRGPASR
ncbi:proteinase [Geotalea uraniireducens]|uniref:Proteinase n=1 Tax=Geotalea uraniireducens TaxID=351604 RepID=A0ABN6VMP9_9BACT|nr:pitrilysin family protein [Geotalea uraniireducens]BDV41468.1 proteinase [Geotalea uraniireducens]